jgi:hypothetical protein
MSDISSLVSSSLWGCRFIRVDAKTANVWFLIRLIDNRSKLEIEPPISDLWPAMFIDSVNLGEHVIAWYLYALLVAQFGYAGF